MRILHIALFIMVTPDALRDAQRQFTSDCQRMKTSIQNYY